MLEGTYLTPSYGGFGNAKRNNMSGLSTDVPVLSKETLSAESDHKGSQLNNTGLTESDLTNLGNGLDVKGSNDVLFYGWPDLGNFEDVDDMLRNCDTTFGLDLENTDDFSWSFPSSQTIEGSTDILTSRFDFPSCNSCDPDTVTRQQEIYGQSSNGMAVNDSHKERILANCKRDSPKLISDSHQIDTQLEVHSHFRPSKHLKLSERKRKDQSSENGLSLIQFDKLCETEESNHLLNSQHSFSPKNHQQREISHQFCLETSVPMIKPNNSLSSDQVLPGFISVNSEVNVCPAKSFKNPSCSENKKKAKSDHSRSSRYTEKCNILVQRADSDILCAKNPTPSGENDVEGQIEVYGSAIGFTGEMGPSAKQSSSCTSSVSDEISIDACSLKQLQHAMMQLDTRTKLCIRNSLYRLARSAAQRHNCVSPSHAEGESKDPIGALLSNGTNKCTGPTDIETDTNPIDRSIAHLLFHRPADPFAASAPVDAMTVKSRTMEGKRRRDTDRGKHAPYHNITWFKRMHLKKETFRKDIDPTINLDEETFISVSHCCERETYQRPDTGQILNVLPSLVEQGKPDGSNFDDCYGMDLLWNRCGYVSTLPQALKRWKDSDGTTQVDATSSSFVVDNTQTGMVARAYGFVESFTSVE